MVIPMPSFRSGGNNFETNSTFVSFGFKTNVSFIFPFVSTHAVSAANTRILAGTAGESRKIFKKTSQCSHGMRAEPLEDCSRAAFTHCSAAETSTLISCFSKPKILPN